MGNTIQTLETKDNYGKFEWKINNDNDENLLDKMLNAKNGELFQSKQFTMNEATWQILIYPNGWNQDNIGDFHVGLKLISLPSSYTAITITSTIKSIETYSSFTMMKKYTTGMSYGWPSYTLSLDEVKEGQYDELRFVISIQILRLQNKTNNIKYIHAPQLKKNYQFTWNMDNKLLKQLQTCRVGKTVYNDDTYDDIWSIGILPDGKSGYEGKCIVDLRLIALSKNISKIKVKWQMDIMQYNITKSATDDYHYDDSYGGLILGSFQEFKRLEQLKIDFQIKITNVYDENGKDITDSYSFDNTQQANDDDEKKYEEPQSIQPSQQVQQNSNDTGLLHMHRGPKDDIDEDDYKEKEIIYKKVKKKSSKFEESTKEKEVNIAVGKIAAGITSAVAAYASGGLLLPVLMRQIKETVINAGWSTSEKNEDIVEQFFEDGTYLFLFIERETNIQKKGFTGFKSKTVKIKCDVKFFYAEAGNEAATKLLQGKATEAAQDALNWIDDNGAGKW